MSYGIYNKRFDKFFTGWTSHHYPVWGDKNHAVPFADRLHAETQAMLLANYYDGGTQRKAVELD